MALSNPVLVARSTNDDNRAKCAGDSYEMHAAESKSGHDLTRRLAYAALAGTACFVLAFLALHIVQPELSPLDEAMSYYVHGTHGWLVTVALLAIGFGSLALVVGLSRFFEGRTARIGLVFLAVWSIGAILGGAFSADPPGNWDRPPSLSGAIHGIAAIIAIAAFPPAAVLIAGGFRRNVQTGRAGSLTNALAVTSVVCFIAFFGSLVPVFVRPGPPVLFGLTERILLAVYAAWLCAAAVGLLRMNRAGAF